MTSPYESIVWKPLTQSAVDEMNKKSGMKVLKQYRSRVLLEQVCDCGHSLQRHGAWRDETKASWRKAGQKHVNGGKCNHDEYCFCIKFSLSQVGEIEFTSDVAVTKLTVRCGMVKVVVDLETGLWTSDPFDDAEHREGTNPSELAKYLRGW